MCSKTVKYTVIAIVDLEFKGNIMRVFSLFGFIKGIFRANFNIKGIQSKGISKTGLLSSTSKASASQIEKS